MHICIYMIWCANNAVYYMYMCIYARRVSSGRGCGEAPRSQETRVLERGIYVYIYIYIYIYICICVCMNSMCVNICVYHVCMMCYD
jgi:hypothetical protein